MCLTCGKENFMIQCGVQCNFRWIAQLIYSYPDDTACGCIKFAIIFLSQCIFILEIQMCLYTPTNYTWELQWKYFNCRGNVRCGTLTGKIEYIHCLWFSSVTVNMLQRNRWRLPYRGRSLKHWLDLNSYFKVDFQSFLLYINCLNSIVILTQCIIESLLD